MAEPGPDVIWINGSFGVGKTSVARRIAELDARYVVLDPEPIGLALHRMQSEWAALADFQDIEDWRSTSSAAIESAVHDAERVVVPMTVVDPVVFAETVGELRRRGVSLRHVTLVAPIEVVRARPLARDGVENHWAKERVTGCVSALRAPEFAVHVDASSGSVDAIARQIVGSVSR